MVVQLINIGTIPILLPNQIIRPNIYVVHIHCIAVSQIVVEALCAPLQAIMNSMDVEQYNQLFKQLAIPFPNYPLSQ